MNDQNQILDYEKEIDEAYQKMFTPVERIQWWSEKDARETAAKYSFDEKSTEIKLYDQEVHYVSEKGERVIAHCDTLRLSLDHDEKTCDSFSRKIHPLIDYSLVFILKDGDEEIVKSMNLKNVSLMKYSPYGHTPQLYVIDKTSKTNSLDFFVSNGDYWKLLSLFFYTVLVNNIFEPKKSEAEKPIEVLIDESYRDLFANLVGGYGYSSEAQAIEGARKYDLSALDTTINFWDLPVSFVGKDGKIVSKHADTLSLTLLHNRIACETLNCQIRPLIDYQLEIRYKDGDEEYKNLISLKDLSFGMSNFKGEYRFFIDNSNKQNSVRIIFYNKIDREYASLFMYVIKANNIFDAKKKAREERANSPKPQTSNTFNFNNIFGGNNFNNLFSINTSEPVKKSLPVAGDKTPYEELDSLIGLDSIKQDIKELASFMKMQQIRKSKGLEKVPVSLHLVFTGNPGTGKTTIARILAGIYKDIGVLSKGQFVEVDRAGLVAGYVGQTAMKTQKVINEAKGGILFIDEAYSLASESDVDFGHEAIDTLLKAMEDNREDFVVIVAGYPDLMRNFIESNPGLQSRFNNYINFPDYSEEEMLEIFLGMCKRYDYKLDGEAENEIKRVISQIELAKDSNFANARTIRNVFEKAITKQATRLASGEYTEEEMTVIKAEDFS